MRIEIAGGIASGKTTFVQALQKKYEYVTPVFEEFSANIFLDDFYNNMQKYAYETELLFLLQHMHQIKVMESKGNFLACDFSLEQDYAYAINNLEQRERISFEKVYLEIFEQVKVPDILIFLQCPSSVLLERVRTRGRKNEMNIDMAYINNTVKNLTEHLSHLDSKVIIVDSNKYDFRNTRDMEAVSKILSAYIIEH